MLDVWELRGNKTLMALGAMHYCLQQVNKDERCLESWPQPRSRLDSMYWFGCLQRLFLKLKVAHDIKDRHVSVTLHGSCCMHAHENSLLGIVVLTAVTSPPKEKLEITCWRVPKTRFATVAASVLAAGTVGAVTAILKSTCQTERAVNLPQRQPILCQDSRYLELGCDGGDPFEKWRTNQPNTDKRWA